MTSEEMPDLPEVPVPFSGEMARTRRVEIRVEPEIVERIYELRGSASLNGWIRTAIVQRLERERPPEPEPLPLPRRRGGRKR